MLGKSQIFPVRFAFIIILTSEAILNLHSHSDNMVYNVNFIITYLLKKGAAGSYVRPCFTTRTQM